jgi:iron(III) transport system substrate-binding protein
MITLLVLVGCGTPPAVPQASAPTTPATEATIVATDSPSTEATTVATETAATSTSTAEQTTDLAALEAAARAEGGTLNYYFSAPASSSEPIFNAFKAKYPFVEIKYTSGGTLELIERVLNETATGRPTADIVQGGPLEDKIFNNDNDLGMDYQTTGKSKVPENMQFNDCNCAVPDFFTFHLIYNTSMLQPDQVPQTLEELTKPEWKGRFGFNLDQLDWFAAELAFRGEEKALELMEALAANAPVVFSGSEGLDMMIAGAFPVMVPMTASGRTARLIEEGAPIAIANMDGDTVLAQPDMYFALKNAPHPNTAKLYLEFIMSEEWQVKLGSELRKTPVHEGAPVHPAAAEVLKGKSLFFETTQNFGDYDTRVKQHQDIFLRSDG